MMIRCGMGSLFIGRLAIGLSPRLGFSWRRRHEYWDYHAGYLYLLVYRRDDDVEDDEEETDEGL